MYRMPANISTTIYHTTPGEDKLFRRVFDDSLKHLFFMFAHNQIKKSFFLF